MKADSQETLPRYWHIREPVKNYLADFFPLAENHFAKKSLMEIAENFLKKMGQKG